MPRQEEPENAKMREEEVISVSAEPRLSLEQRACDRRLEETILPLLLILLLLLVILVLTSSSPIPEQTVTTAAHVNGWEKRLRSTWPSLDFCPRQRSRAGEIVPQKETSRAVGQEHANLQGCS
jgi:hypothetical protein